MSLKRFLVLLVASLVAVHWPTSVHAQSSDANGARPYIQLISPAQGATFLVARSNNVTLLITNEVAPSRGFFPNEFTYNGSLPPNTFGSFKLPVGTAETLTTLPPPAANEDYRFELTTWTDAHQTNSTVVFFDTFSPTNTVVEMEYYDFEGGGFLDLPFPASMDDPPVYANYEGRVGVAGVDYFKPASGSQIITNAFRPQDSVGITRRLDYLSVIQLPLGLDPETAPDYSLTAMSRGQWMNYTRTLKDGIYRPFLRQLLLSSNSPTTLFDQVASGVGTTNQSLMPLGIFRGEPGWPFYRNVPLQDAFGTPMYIRLAGVNTVRLTASTENATGINVFQNYLVFVPSTNLVTLRPAVVRVSPFPGERVESVPAPILQVNLLNRDTSVDLATVQLQLNGSPVKPTIRADSSSTVSLTLQTDNLQASNQVRFAFKDSAGVGQTNSWSFVYANALAPAIELLASDTANGAYHVESGASINTDTKTITVSLPGQSRFYGLRATGLAGRTIRMINVSRQGDILVIHYEMKP